MDDLTCADFAQRGTADRLIGVRSGTAPDGITGSFRAVGKHCRRGDSAQFDFGHTRFDIFENGFETDFRNFCGFAQTLKFQRRFLHKHRAQNGIGIDDIFSSAERIGNVAHNGVGEHVEPGDTEPSDGKAFHDRLPVRMGGTGVVRLGGFTEIHRLDDCGKFGTRRSISQCLRSDDQRRLTVAGDKHARRFKTGPVIGKITHSGRFGFS